MKLISLPCFDDKRFVLDDGVHAYFQKDSDKKCDKNEMQVIIIIIMIMIMMIIMIMIMTMPMILSSIVIEVIRTVYYYYFFY